MSEGCGVAVLLAGGRGERLAAGVPKALARFGDHTLLAHALGRLRPLVHEIRVVAPASLDLGPLDGARLVADPPGDTGPLGALVAGLGCDAFEGAALVFAVDLPGVTAEALRALLAARGEAAAVIASVDGVPQPLAGGYAMIAAEGLARAWQEGERSLTRAALGVGARVVPAESLPGDPARWLNVNTPADLVRALGFREGASA